MINTGTSSEAHIDSFLESSEEIVIILDGNDKILRLSKGARQQLGYEEKDVTGDSILSLVPTDRRDWMVAVTKRAREDSAVQDVFMHWRTRDGRRLIARSSLKSVVNYHGNIVGVIISETRKLPLERKGELMTPEQAIELLQASEIALIVTDLSGNVLSYSSGAETFTGLASSQVVGSSISRLFTDKEAVGEITTSALRDGKVEDFELTLLGANEERKQVSVSLSVIRNPSGAPMSFSFVIVDITKRKEMEKELENRADRLRLVNDLARRVGSGRSLSEIYSTASEGLARLIDFDMMTLINIADTDGGVQILSFEGDHPGWLSKGEIIEFGKGPLGRALMERKPIIYSSADIEELPKFGKSDQEKIRSGVVIPLLAGERLLGLLDFTASKAVAFGESEMTVLIPVADHIALAMENSRLVTALMENINIQTSLMETGTALRSIIELQKIYDTSISRARELINSNLGALYILKGDILELVATEGIDRKHLAQEITAEDENLVSLCFFESGDALIRNVRECEEASEEEKKYFGSLMMGRLVGMEGPMGLLLLARITGDKTFSSYELELLGLYCNHLSPSIENAHLFESTKSSEVRANEALESERRTREAIDFVFNMFAHDSQNQFQAVLGYLELMSQADLSPQMRNFVERAARQLKAGSFLLSDTRLLFKHIGGEKISRSSDELLLALEDSVYRFSGLYPDIELRTNISPPDDSHSEIDALLSGLFFHIIRLVSKTSNSPWIDIELSKSKEQKTINVSFGIKSGSSRKGILKKLEEEKPSKENGLQLLAPFVVRLLSEIYGARIWMADLKKDKDKSGIVKICGLEFRDSENR